MSAAETTVSVRSDVAVVLCTYNGARHLAEQLESVWQQTVLPGEIRVYDDGSTDASLSIAEETWERRPARSAQVRLHIAPHSERSFGAAQNFARAIVDSPQPILALSDQDDVWMPERLEAAIDVLDSDPAIEVVASNAVMTDGGGVSVGRTVFEAQRLSRREWVQFGESDFLPALARRNVVPGMTFTIRRTLMERLGPLPEGAMHDYWLVVAAASRNTLAILPRSLVRYRIHAANAVGLDTGSRTLGERIRVKLRHLRAPLTDLPQWTALPDRLVEAGDPAAAERLLAKRDFELARRYPDRAPLALLRSGASLIAGSGYLTYEFQGRATGFRDLVRRRDPYLGRAASQ